MRCLKFIFVLLLPLVFSWVAADEETKIIIDEESVNCELYEEFVDGKCIDRCVTLEQCGNFTRCETVSWRTHCSCLKGYSGNPLTSCFKMNEESPCDPNPCGENAECVEADEVAGPHCRCKKNFFDWPPNCRVGCNVNSDCPGETELCNKNNECIDVCKESCGENSNCRVNKEVGQMYCSCKDGFVPTKEKGCVPKAPDTPEIPIDLIDEVTKYPCARICGRNAYCDFSTGLCVCTQGYAGNATQNCDKIESPDHLDACSPNPCGPYSECKIVDGEKKCSCIDGYGTADPPYCSGCYSSSGCDIGMICSNGRCILSPCTDYCGSGASCNVHKGVLECFCENFNTASSPFEGCYDIAFIPPNVVATLLG